MNPPTRGGPVRISVFNHKGGVGKTTITMNLGATLARMGRRVLLVDSDPQCNLTSYLVTQEVVDDLLDTSDGEDGRTIWSALKPVSEGLGGFRYVAPIESGIERLFLLPGDIRLSEFESDLNEFWGLTAQRKLRGFRGTTAISELITAVARNLDIDYVFYDSGPNIGPLNRAVLLDCDYFIIPVACDLFSLRALRTLGRTLGQWVTSWSAIRDLAPDDVYVLPGLPTFLGYIPEGFRVYRGTVASQPARFLARIDKEIQQQIVTVLRGVDPRLAEASLPRLRLGGIKNLGALIPASQDQGALVYEVEAGSPEQRTQARKAFRQLATRVDNRVRELRGL